MNKSNFFRVFDQAWETIKSRAESAASGFRRAGLVPFDADAIDYTQLINEKAARTAFQSQNNALSTDVQLGIHITLQCFEKC